MLRTEFIVRYIYLNILKIVLKTKRFYILSENYIIKKIINTTNKLNNNKIKFYDFKNNEHELTKDFMRCMQKFEYLLGVRASKIHNLADPEIKLELVIINENFERIFIEQAVLRLRIAESMHSDRKGRIEETYEDMLYKYRIKSLSEIDVSDTGSYSEYNHVYALQIDKSDNSSLQNSFIKNDISNSARAYVENTLLDLKMSTMNGIYHNELYRYRLELIIRDIKQNSIYMNMLKSYIYNGNVPIGGEGLSERSVARNLCRKSYMYNGDDLIGGNEGRIVRNLYRANFKSTYKDMIVSCGKTKIMANDRRMDRRGIKRILEVSNSELRKNDK